MIKIELIKFYKETGLADFEVTKGKDEYFTCHADVCLNDFIDGQQVIKPTSWFDMEEDYVDQPEWFKRNELFLLNNVFEEHFRKFL